MFNNKFGLKADFGYNSFKDGSDSKVLTQNIIEQFTSCCKLGKNHEFRNLDKYYGLLAHTGFGLDFLKTR
jgi:OOP family OmpA-OmpF porin